MNFKNIFFNNEEKPKPFLTSISESLTYDYNLEFLMLENLSSIEEEFFNIMKEHTYATYMGIKSNNCEILEEGFKEIMNGAAKFFKNIIDRVIEFFKKAFTFFNSYIGDFDKFMSKHKDIVNKLEPDFTIKMFTYTFDKKVPNINRIQDIINTYNRDLDKIRDIKYTDLLNEKAENMSKSNLDKIRGEVISESGGISEENYLSHIKESFRNGESDTKEVHINKSKLSETIENYSKVKRILQETRNEQIKIVGLLNNIKRFFDANPSVYYSGSKKMVGTKNININDNKLEYGEKKEIPYEHDQLKILNLFFSYKFEQSKALSVMITNVYFEKIKALEEAIKVYKRIIRDSIFEVEKPSGDKKEGDKK